MCAKTLRKLGLALCNFQLTVTLLGRQYSIVHFCTCARAKHSIVAYI